MNKIPLMIPPVKDELLISFMARLSKYNGFDNFPLFMYAYFHTESGQERPYYNVVPDANPVFYRLMQSCNSMYPWDAFYIEHTIYPGIAPFLTRMQQAHTVNIAFRGREDFLRIISKTNGTIDSLKVCPECMKNEIQEHGFFIYHRKHHMPGVCVCYKHHCPLHIYQGTTRNILSENGKYAEMQVQNIDSESCYAEFAGKWLDAEIDTDISALADAVFRKLKADGITADKYQSFADEIYKSPLSDLFDTDIVSFLKVTLINRIYVNQRTLLSLLLYLFEKPENILPYLQKDIDSMMEFISALDGYDVYEPVRGTLVCMRKTDTGEVFYTTPAGFLASWRELSRDNLKTEKKKFEEIFEAVSDGEYTLLSEFDGMDNSILVKHSCGKQMKTAARSFIEEGSRCACENMVSFGQASRIVGKHEGFRLIEFNGTENPVTIHHDKCKHDFQCVYKKFIRFPTCRYCESIKKYNNITFREQIKSLVGDEYTVTGEYHGENELVRIRHNVCGNEQEYYGKHFLNGQRCRICSRELPYEEFCEKVEQSTNGRYQILGKDGPNLFIIIDTVTLKSMSLSKSRIIQEINRPTMSKIIPVEGRRKKILPKRTVADKIMDTLRKEYGNDELIFLEDIHIKGISYQILRSRLRELADENRIFHIASGIYSLSEQDVLPDRLIQEKYLCRNGNPIGVYYRESIAYEYGFINEKPDMISIQTNKEAGLTGRLVNAFGKKIRLMGCEFEIDNTTKEIAEAINILSCSLMKVCSKETATGEAKKYIHVHCLTYEQFLPYISGQKSTIKNWIEEIFSREAK